MRTFKIIRGLALLHARGFCHKQQPCHHQPRSSVFLLAALEEHTSGIGKELLSGLKDAICWEKDSLEKEKEQEREMRSLQVAKEREMRSLQVASLEKEKEKEREMRSLQVASLEKLLSSNDEWTSKLMASMEREISAKEKAISAKEAEISAKDETLHLLKDERNKAVVKNLSLEDLNDTRGLFEMMEEVLANQAGHSALKGSHLWEAILNANPTLSLCIEKHTKIKAKDVLKQAAHCHTIYNVLSQHIHASKEPAKLQAVNGKILFRRGPMSPEQLEIFLCIGQAANFDIQEDPSTRPC